jgi:hypothetical protein
VDQVGVVKVCISEEVADGDGTEEDDGEWKFVGNRGDWLTPDPVANLRPMGAKSKFWASTDDEVATQSPYTPDLVRHAAVHGFTKDRLCEAELALQDSSVRNIMRVLIDVRRLAVSPWLGKLS